MKVLNKEIENEIIKQHEFQIEEEKLKEVLLLVKDETLKTIDYRKNIQKDILEYRKKYIEEYKDDEDKVTEYFDHEEFVVEEAYKSADKRLRELTMLSVSPYFGRIDIKDEDDYETLYIGRFGLLKNDFPVVVDWRAPVASIFYNGGLGKASYKAPFGENEVDVMLRRQYVIKKAKLCGMFDSAFDIKDEILQQVLMENSGEKLKEIVTTIQKEQDEIIRQPKNTTVIVDGVAGSGKTTIALHRVAYLLYNYREYFKDKVLILGPDNIFMDYIKEVLPALGESGVSQNTFTEFACKLLDVHNVMSFKEYMEKVLKNDTAFIEEIKHKGSISYIFEMDALAEEMNKSYFKPHDILFGEEKVIPKEALLDLYEYYKEMPLFRRLKKIKRIIIGKLKDIRDSKVREINAWYKDAEAHMSQKEKEEQFNNLSYLRKVKIRETIVSLINSKRTLNFLNEADVLELYNVYNKKDRLIDLDLAAILYLKIKLQGFKLKSSYRHIVIDEAQDFSMLQFMVIKYITGCTNMTITGDSNQRITPMEEEIPMKHIDEFLKDLNVKFFNLKKSYRSTKEIMTYANSIINNNDSIPYVRSGNEVIIKDHASYDEISDTLQRFLDEGCSSIGIICTTCENASVVYNNLKVKDHISFAQDEDFIYQGGITIMPSYYAKGMEFDGVIYVNFHNDGTIKNEKLNYVIATRALHNLAVVNMKLTD